MAIVDYKLHTVCLTLHGRDEFICDGCATSCSSEDGDTTSWTESPEETTAVVAEKKKDSLNKNIRELRKLNIDLVGETRSDKVTVEEDAHADMDWIESNVVISVSKRRKEEDDKRKDTIKKMAAQEKARAERMAVDPHRTEVERTYGDDICSICVRPLVGWVQQLLCCNKFLHAECVNTMMTSGGRIKRCPMCRSDIQPDIYKPSKAKSVAVAANIGEKVLLPDEEDFGNSTGQRS